jgi:hypothetical protein
MKRMQDLFDLRGFLTLFDGVAGPAGLSKGKVLHADKNIITTVGRERVARLITGLSTDFVDQMAIGDGGAPQGDLLVPIVPVLSDTALAHELRRSNVVNPAVVGQVLTFTSTFLTASLTPIDFINPLNQVINEAGLFCVDGAMFARKTFPSIPFSPGDRVGVIAEWSIEVL